LRNEDKVAQIKVASKSSVKAVAGSITKCLEDGKVVEVFAIGAGAVNQAVKACGLASGFIATKGYSLIMRPGFHTTQIEGEEKTTVKFVVSIQ
jgi:stage V sporulation protein S